ncbi:glycosyltransferase family 9 protein [Spirosoma sp. KCTC 42546]|uniref:glycosyltransferase family 9 protein n=1 Tax=Spirosoma sp. KCTC 42546 TaxID=2520506 RepID=UPI00115B1B68|nr:glycosyltransferase family 9 protein [Spirosoma sp. KCTC 42546]QDK82049.1 glycosyltransferase family 9 protein [Spirosoma sp. KCTC 42546]
MITATKPPRFLIIQTAFIGDVILATALLEQLHEARPDAILDVLVRQGNESLLANHPFLTDVLVWQKKGTKYRDLWRLLRTVRERKYDAVLNLQRYGTMGLLTAFSGAKVTIGFTKNPFARFFTHQVDHRFEPGVHEVDRNAGMLPVLGIAEPPRHRPKLYPSVADYTAVKGYQSQSYVCMAPMSVWFTKQYPTERWVELIKSLPKNLTIYLLGAPTDMAACEILKTLSERAEVVNLAGKLSLLKSAALQQGAVMNYVNDSAPLHLCSAMNAPTTAIFCSTVPEFGFGPLADVSRVVQTPELLDCKPCNLHGRKACPLGHFKCAWGIRVEELAQLDL